MLQEEICRNLFYGNEKKLRKKFKRKSHLNREKIQEAIGRMTMGKATVTDGISELQKYGRRRTVHIIQASRKPTWELDKVP